MSLITVIWSMTAAVCLTVAGVHFLVWARERGQWESLFLTVSAVAAAALAMQELMMMRAQTPAEFGEALRWMHLSAATLIIALVWFIRRYLRAGRLWLAWLISGMRVLVLVPNFLMFPNATFREIHGLKHVSFLGETFSIPVGETNPWRLVIHLSTLFLLVYVLDAAISAWKQGKRERSLVLGAAISIAIVLAVIFSALLVRGMLPGAFVGPVFLLIVLAMAFEMSVDLIRAGQLSRDLLASQKRMNLAAQAANMALWEWDIVRDRIWASDVGRALAGTAGPERIGFDRALQQIHPDDRAAVREAVRRTTESGANFQTEYRLTDPDGATRWMAAHGLLERGGRGEPLLMRGVSIDITERKRIELELQKRRDELAHVQRVSTMGQLSAALAHELNQPLGAILRNAEAGELILRQDPTDVKELQDILSDIQQDERRAAGVIERMRSLIKRREIQFETIAVDELVEPVATLLRTEFQSRQATLHVAIMHGLPKICGDRVQLQQVILNLLLNSLDALESNKDGMRQVTIGARRVNDETVELAVGDNGAGIDPAQLPHLFEPFFTTKVKGTGVGLAISKTIIEAHGGQIWAENNPDGGATFRVTLPVTQAGAAA